MLHSYNMIFNRSLCFFLCFSLCGLTPVQARDIVLPKPGAMVLPSTSFTPPALKGIKINPDDPLSLDFILDTSHTTASPASLDEESRRLVKYFLAAMTIPEDDLWVNLSPYEHSKIIPESLGRTDMGRDLLALDYLLKQVTASLLHPEDALGQTFWKTVYARAKKISGGADIPVNTFNKVWIVPSKAVVLENPETGAAYIAESSLNVLLEQDYLSMEHNGLVNNSTAGVATQTVRDIVIPQLIREVNEGKNFAHLRQVYNSLILAAWYKRKIKGGVINEVYADKNKIQGIARDEAFMNPEDVYKRYLQAFKMGVYSLIKEEPNTEGRMVPRKYFSGGVKLVMDGAMTTQTVSRRDLLRGGMGAASGYVVRAALSPVSGAGIAASAVAFYPRTSEALPQPAVDFIRIQNEYQGLQIPADGLNERVERSLNGRVSAYLARPNQLNSLTHLKQFIERQRLNLGANPYTTLIRALKTHFDALKARRGLSAAELEAWGNLQDDTINFIHRFLLVGASYQLRQRSVMALIDGISPNRYVFNCDAISALTVLIGNDAGIDTIQYADVARDHTGRIFPDAQGVGHTNNILMRADGKLVMFDQMNRIEPARSPARVTTYNEEGIPTVVDFSALRRDARLYTLVDLLEGERIQNIYKQIYVNDRISADDFRTVETVERLERLLNEANALSRLMNREQALIHNHQRAVQTLHVAKYNLVINKYRVDTAAARQLFDARNWVGAAEAYKRIADYLAEQEAVLRPLRLEVTLMTQLRNMREMSLRNHEAARTNERITSRTPSAPPPPALPPGAPSRPPSAPAVPPQISAIELIRQTQERANALMRSSQGEVSSARNFDDRMNVYATERASIEQAVGALPASIPGLTITDGRGRTITPQEHGRQIIGVLDAARENLLIGEYNRLAGIYNQTARGRNVPEMRNIAVRINEVITKYSPISQRLTAQFNQLRQAADRAMSAERVGGIDLRPALMDLDIRAGSAEILLQNTPELMSYLHDAAGFAPLLIDITPLRDLSSFMGISPVQ